MERERRRFLTFVALLVLATGLFGVAAAYKRESHIATGDRPCVWSKRAPPCPEEVRRAANRGENAFMAAMILLLVAGPIAYRGARGRALAFAGSVVNLALIELRGPFVEFWLSALISTFLTSVTIPDLPIPRAARELWSGADPGDGMIGLLYAPIAVVVTIVAGILWWRSRRPRMA